MILASTYRVTLLILSLFIGDKSTFSQAYMSDSEVVYSLNPDLSVDSFNLKNHVGVVLKVGYFGCTGCLAKLGRQLDSLKTDSVVLVYYSLPDDYTQKEFVQSYLSSMNDADNKLKLYSFKYRLTIGSRSQLIERSPFIVNRCEDEKVVTYSYSDLFEKGKRISVCD